MKKLGYAFPKKPKINIRGLEELLLSASKLFPLITIHRENVRRGECWIGKIEEVGDGRVSLLEIGPDAKWDHKPSSYNLNEITSVEFGGEYERALSLVGGNPPSHQPWKSGA
ncbi:MAG: hypothetical protein WB421_05275 [Terriglobales bacterium]